MYQREKVMIHEQRGLIITPNTYDMYVWILEQVLLKHRSSYCTSSKFGEHLHKSWYLYIKCFFLQTPYTEEGRHP